MNDILYSNGKENSKNISSDHIDRDYDQESLAFIDPAISIFDSSTPKYKMRSVDSPSSELLSSSKWEAQKSLSRQDKIQNIIDFRSNKDGEDVRDQVNMQTPTRHKKTVTVSPPEQTSPSQDDDYNSTRDGVIRTLDFSALDADSTSMITDTTSATPQGVRGDPSTPGAAGDGGTLSRPKADVSPETETLKQSSLQGALKSKVPLSVGNGDTPSSRHTHVISPTQSKVDSDFAHHLVGSGRDGGERLQPEESFIDALSRSHTDMSGSNTPTRNTPHQRVDSTDAVMTTPLHQPTKTPSKGENSHNKPTRVAPSPALVNVPSSVSKTPHKRSHETVFAEGGALHDEWKVTVTPQGKKYYYNRRTRMSAWT